MTIATIYMAAKKFGELPTYLTATCPICGAEVNRLAGTTDNEALVSHYIDRHAEATCNLDVLLNFSAFTKNPDKAFACPCGLVFRSKWELFNHLSISGLLICVAEGILNRAAGPMKITCPVCGANSQLVPRKIFVSTKDLVQHFINVHHGVDGLRQDNVCRCFCGRAFKTLGDLTAHLDGCLTIVVAEQVLHEAAKTL